MATYKEIKGVTVQTVDSDPVIDGGSWSSGGTMNSARTSLQSGGTGSANAIVAGGYNAGSDFKTRSESYNGTSWTETSENNDARQFGGGAGTNTNAIIAGGDPSSFYTASETWNGSAWTEAPNMNTNKNQNQLTGNATAAITAGGGNPSAIANVESWNGSAWTETSYDLNTAKKLMEQGIVLWIAPEGTRSQDGKLQAFKKGTFITAIQTKATLIPLAIEGAFELYDSDTKRVRLNQKIKLTIGEPIDSTEYAKHDKESLMADAHKTMSILLEP